MAVSGTSVSIVVETSWICSGSARPPTARTAAGSRRRRASRRCARVSEYSTEPWTRLAIAVADAGAEAGRVDVADVADEIVAERPTARPACRRRTASPADRRRAGGTRAATRWPTRCRARPRPPRGWCARPRADWPAIERRERALRRQPDAVVDRRQELFGARRDRAAREHRADAEVLGGLDRQLDARADQAAALEVVVARVARRRRSASATGVIEKVSNA